MELVQAIVLLATFGCALGGLLLAFRVERRVTKMFGKGNMRDALLQFFSGVPDDEGNEIPPQAAFYAFCSGIARDVTDYAIEQLPGALVSLRGPKFAKKAAESSAFARGAQHLSEGGFGELNNLRDMAGELFSKIGTGGDKGDWVSQLAPMFIQKMMAGGDNGNTPMLQSQPAQRVNSGVEWRPPTR